MTLDGDRKDLRRFTSQIYEKLSVNRDRYNTPQARMSYVTSRLTGVPYQQILPYIHKGQCELSDYEEIIVILERSFVLGNLSGSHDHHLIGPCLD